MRQSQKDLGFVIASEKTGDPGSIGGSLKIKHIYTKIRVIIKNIAYKYSFIILTYLTFRFIVSLLILC
jgi:hypothetical protein